MSKVDIEKKVKKKKYGIILIILILIISVFFVLLTQTSFFDVKRDNIILKNSKTLDRDKIIMASGLGLNENIFILDKTAMKKNLLLHPYIKNAKINRLLPNKVIIKIEERMEMYVVPHLGSYIYLDGDGYILDVLVQRKDENLPLVHGLSIKSFTKGETIEIDNDIKLEDITNVIESFKDYSFLDKVISLTIVDNKEIDLKLKRGTKVAFGDLNNVQYKLSFLLEIFKELESREDITDEVISKSEIDLTKDGEGVFRYSGN